jgi:hypothetical protein
MKKPFKAKGNTTRRVAGTMNKTEQAYAALLDQRKLAGEIHHWGFEAMALRLADRTTYTPDFFVIDKDGLIEWHEVKGHWMGNGRVKIKVAAALHPWFRFVAIKYIKKSWVFEEF